MKYKKLAFIGVLFASLIFLISIPALAQCPEDDPDCPLEPPQSEQVGPQAESVEGETSEVGEPGGANPQDFTVPRPVYIDPVPFGSGVESGSSNPGALTEVGSTETAGGGLGEAAPWVLAATAAGAIAVTAPSVLKNTKPSLLGGGGSSSASGGSTWIQTGSNGSFSSTGIQGQGVPGAGGQGAWGAEGGSYTYTSEGTVVSRGGVDPYAGYGRTAGTVEGVGPAEAGSGGSYGLGGGQRDEDRDSQLLPRATWIPSNPPQPTPQPPVDPGGGVSEEDVENGTKIGDKSGSILRNLANSEVRSEFISRAASTVYNPIRQAAILAAGTVANTTRRGLNGLSDSINDAVQTMGRGWDGVNKGINSAVENTFGRASDFIQGKILNPVNGMIPGGVREAIRNRGGVRGIAQSAWQGVTNRAGQIRTQLTQPNSASFNTKLDLTSAFGAGISLVGNLIHNKTGSQGALDAAGVGDVISGGANLVGFRGRIASLIQNGIRAPAASGSISTFGKVASVVAKGTGVLAAIGGAVTAAKYGSQAWDDYQEDGELSREGKISAVKAIGGGLGAIGGVLLLTPAAPLGGAFLAASGIVSAGTWVAENFDRLKQGAQAYKGVVENAKTIVRTVTTRAINTVRNRVTTAASTIRNTVRETTSRVASGVTRTVRDVSSRVSSAVNTAVDKAKNFFGNLFGSRPSPAPSPAPRPTPSSRSTPSPRRTSLRNTSKTSSRGRGSPKSSRSSRTSSRSSRTSRVRSSRTSSRGRTTTRRFSGRYRGR